jgi:hypothetical protein
MAAINIHPSELLASIAQSGSWMSDLMEGRIGSFGEIAERENKVVRHVRRLLPPTFLSPESSMTSRTEARLLCSPGARPHAYGTFMTSC